jgi:hypothetical protein
MFEKQNVSKHNNKTCDSCALVTIATNDWLLCHYRSMVNEAPRRNRLLAARPQLTRQTTSVLGAILRSAIGT